MDMLLCCFQCLIEIGDDFIGMCPGKRPLAKNRLIADQF
jgi:hypothetical protein